MVFGLLGATALGIGGAFTGVGIGKWLGGGGGSDIGAGFIEVGTLKTKKDIQVSTSTQITYAPVTTTTSAYQPVYTYAPQYQISSPYAQQVSKPSIKALVEPTVTPTIAPILATAQTQGGGGQFSIWEELKPMMLLGAIGFGAFLLFRGKK